MKYTKDEKQIVTDFFRLKKDKFEIEIEWIMEQDRERDFEQERE